MKKANLFVNVPIDGRLRTIDALPRLRRSFPKQVEKVQGGGMFDWSSIKVTPWRGKSGVACFLVQFIIDGLRSTDALLRVERLLRKLPATEQVLINGAEPGLIRWSKASVTHWRGVRAKSTPPPPAAPKIAHRVHSPPAATTKATKAMTDTKRRQFAYIDHFQSALAKVG